MEETKKKPKYNLRLALLYVCSFLVSVLPVAITLIVKWDAYTTTPKDTVKLCLGGTLALVFVGLKVVGKLKIPHRIVLFGFIFLMAYLFQSILPDLLLLSGMAFIGETIDAILFQALIKKTKEDKVVSKTSNKTTEQITAVLDNYFNGRT